MPKFGLELDPTRNIIVPSVSESEKDLPEEKEDGDSYERGENADDFEIDRNLYEGQVEKKDIDQFLHELNGKISAKAEDFGVNGENEMKLFKQKVFWLAKLDFENMDDGIFAKELEDMKLTNGGLDFLRDAIFDAIEDVHIDRQGKMVADRFSVVDKAMELMRKHKKVFSIGALTLYLSAFGSGILKPLSGDHAKIIMDDNGFEEDGKNGTNSAGSGAAVQENNSGSDTDMGGANSAQLAGTFNQYEKEKSAIGRTDGTQSLEAFEKFEEENFIANNKDGSIGVIEFRYEDVKFSFSVEKGKVYLNGLFENTSEIEQDLQKDGLSFDTMKNSGYPLETFLEKEDVIVGAMAKHLGVPESNLELYTDSVLDGSIGVITAEELMENPEMITLINESRDENSPINVLRQASDIGEFKYKDVEFSFSVKKGKVYLNGLFENTSGIEQDLLLIRMENSGYPLETFLEKEDVIVGAMAKHLGVPESNLKSYTDKVLMLDTSKIEVVKFKDFNVPTDKDNPETIKLKNAKEEIYKKYGLDSFGQIIVDESLQKQIDGIVTNDAGLVDATTQEQRDMFLKKLEKQRFLEAENELGEWTERKYGHDDFDSEMHNWDVEESENYPLKMKIDKLGVNGVSATTYDNSEEFEDMFLKGMEKEGYTLSDLDNMAKKNPRMVVEAVSRMIDANLGCDQVEAKYISAHTFRDLPNHPESLKHSKKHKSMPAASLGTHAGVCHDYSITLAAGLDVLKKLGLSNMDNYAVLGTTFQGQHKYILLATYKDEHIMVSLVDPTFADFDASKLDAAGEDHAFHGISREVYEKYKEKLEDKKKKQIEQNFEETKENQDKEEKLKKHNEILKRIQYRNFLVFQQEIIDMITKYDPKATRGRKIIVDKESYRKIRQRERQKVMEVRKQIAQDGEDKK